MKMKMTVLAMLMAVTPQTRATINRAFRADEFEILWTANPSEAAEASIRCRPGLVLLDLNRPLHQGLGIFHSLRTLNPSAPIVVLSEHRSAHDEGVAKQAGVVLPKPFGAAVLADTANALLKASSKSAVPHVSDDPEFWGATTDSGRFRKTLLARYNTPFAIAPSYRHWGINE